RIMGNDLHAVFESGGACSGHFAAVAGFDNTETTCGGGEQVFVVAEGGDVDLDLPGRFQDGCADGNLDFCSVNGGLDGSEYHEMVLLFGLDGFLETGSLREGFFPLSCKAGPAFDVCHVFIVEIPERGKDRV